MGSRFDRTLRGARDVTAGREALERNARDLFLPPLDGWNKLWVWHGSLAEDAWGWAVEEAGAKQALEVWLRGWLENFRTFMSSSPANRPRRAALFRRMVRRPCRSLAY